MLLHQLTLTSGLCGVLQQLKHHSTVTQSVLQLSQVPQKMSEILFMHSYLLLVFAKKTDHQKKNMHRGCTHKVSLSLLLLLNLFHHFSDSLQLGVHKLLLQLLVLEHLVYMLPGIHQISIRLDNLWYALL